MSVPITINAATPFLIGVQNSQVSQEWLRFLGAIVTIVTGNQGGGITTDDVTTLLITNALRPPQPAIDELRRRMGYLEDQVRSSQRREMNSRISKLEEALLLQRKVTHVPLSIVSKNIEETRSTQSGCLTVQVNDDNLTPDDVFPMWSGGFAGQRRARISSLTFKFNPLSGQLTAKALVATTGFGCNGKTAQTAYASGGAVVTTASVNVAPYGYTTAAQADDIVTKLNNVITALKNDGIMS